MSEPDLRMCRKWNRWTNRKEYCLAKFYGDNLSGAVTFFGTDRPLPSQVEAAKTYYLKYLQEQDDAGENQQVAGWEGASFDAWRNEGKVNKHGQGQGPGATIERDRPQPGFQTTTEEIANARR